MALGEFCMLVILLLFLGLIFPLLELIIILVSPQFHIKSVKPKIKKHNTYSQLGDLKNARRYNDENSFADAILWADVGNDL